MPLVLNHSIEATLSTVGMLRNRLSPQRTPPFCQPQAAHSAHSFSWAVATGQECEGEVRVEEG